MTETAPEHPVTPTDPGPSGDLSLTLRMLYDEQARLRAEVDNLRKKQTQDGSGDSKDSKDRGKQDQGKEDQGKKGSQDQQKQDEQKQEDKEDQKEEKKPPLKERVRTWTKEHPMGTILIVVGFVVLLIAGILLWEYISSYENTDDAFVDGHTDPISPRISGIVTAVYVENTYRVKKGQPLVQLDPRDYQVALEQAGANLEQAQASLRAQAPNVPITETSQSTVAANADLGVASARANLSAAQQRYRAAQSDLQQAEETRANAAREEERYKALVVKAEVSRELYDQRATDARAQSAQVASRTGIADAAAKDVAQAESALDQAQQRMKEATHNLPRQIAIQQETVSMRKANEQAAQAQAGQARLNLEYTRICAPADGIVGDKSVELGTQVAPGQELLALTQTDDIWVTANFKETEIRKMHPGQSVTIHVDALSQKFEGYVEALPGASGAVYSLLPPENATGNYVKVVQRLPVRIRFKPNQPGAERLAPGMSVEPKVWIK
jgi:membrane fusion protein (multidrug efflux system)